MSNQNDGGPAFSLGPTDSTMQPMQDGTLIVTHYGMAPGITIRDYFAAAALQGVMAAHTSGGCLVDDLYAKYAYDLADAMLKAREVKP